MQKEEIQDESIKALLDDNKTAYQKLPAIPQNSKNDVTADFEEKEEEKVKILFQNKKAYSKSGCCGHLFFTWITPLINFTRKHQSLIFEQMGNLPDNDMVEVHLERLQNAWLERKNQGLQKNTLINSVFASFRGDYIYLFSLNAVQSVLTLLGPFFINFLVNYVRTGENPYE